MLQALTALLVVFAITLLMSKSNIFACKREFVQKRYDASKVNNEIPCWIHRIWHAIWLCSMCSGFWVAVPVSFFTWSGFSIIPGIFVLFGGNWLLHCLESCLFGIGKILEKMLDEEE